MLCGSMGLLLCLSLVLVPLCKQAVPNLLQESSMGLAEAGEDSAASLRIQTCSSSDHEVGCAGGRWKVSEFTCDSEACGCFIREGVPKTLCFP